MYQKILVTLDTSASDPEILSAVTSLAAMMKSELLLLHVADGWVARNFNQLKLAESEEMKADRAYLNEAAGNLRILGLTVSTHLALGDPATEILKTAVLEQCDLIAMTSHGHRFIGDIIYGSTINEVRHRTTIPVLLVRAEQK